MSNARIPGATPADVGLIGGLFQRIVYFFVRRILGRVSTPIAVLGHHPLMLAGYAGMEQAFKSSTQLPPAIRSLVSIRAASLIGCPF